nr:MBL fold metallo-hydrolase [Streptomyces sp. TLI_235]
MDVPTADRWFEVHELGGGVARITEPHVDPLLRGNLWWLRGGDRDVIVDAGLGVAELHRELTQLFERDPLAVLTHAHLDHVGGAYEFRERAAHAAAAEVLARGVPARLRPPDLRHPAAGGDPRPPGRGGDRPRGRRLTVIHLPGHTPGCIALEELIGACSPGTWSTATGSSTTSPSRTGPPTGAA